MPSVKATKCPAPLLPGYVPRWLHNSENHDAGATRLQHEEALAREERARPGPLGVQRHLFGGGKVTQPVLIYAHHPRTRLVVELPKCTHGFSLLAGWEPLLHQGDSITLSQKLVCFAIVPIWVETKAPIRAASCLVSLLEASVLMSRSAAPGVAASTSWPSSSMRPCSPP